jgi:hypothetical protein
MFGGKSAWRQPEHTAMRLSYEQCEDYLARVAALLEGFGVVFSRPAAGEDLVLEESRRGVISYELRGELVDPDGDVPARVEIREQFTPVRPDVYERARYAYELRDEARDYRRAFHLHSPEAFMSTYLVVVHEHCERPIGTRQCEHYEGSPVKDAFAGVRAIMDLWTDDPPDCGRLHCLDDRRASRRRARSRRP